MLCFNTPSYPPFYPPTTFPSRHVLICETTAREHRAGRILAADWLCLWKGKVLNEIERKVSSPKRYAWRVTAASISGWGAVLPSVSVSTHRLACPSRIVSFKGLCVAVCARACGWDALATRGQGRQRWRIRSSGWASCANVWRRCFAHRHIWSDMGRERAVVA